MLPEEIVVYDIPNAVFLTTIDRVVLIFNVCPRVSHSDEFTFAVEFHYKDVKVARIGCVM